MSSKKIKQAKIKRAMSQPYKGFLPVKKKIKRDLRSIRLGNKENV